jgi:very-short-patch-repair endonuclease/predicted transcriptional regulator of viral defense system
MDAKGDTGDERIAAVAARQYGAISTRQLAAMGVGRGGIRARVAGGRLHRLHQGVYAVGHVARSPERDRMAAVLACGRGVPGLVESSATVLERWGGAVSHRTAAVHWRLLAVESGPVDVLVSGRQGKRQQRGIRLHRSTTLLPADVTVKDGIPVTKPARTIADLQRIAGRPADAGGIPHRALRRAIRQAEFFDLPLEPGTGDRTRSDLERDFLRLCRRHRLPPPEVNVRVGRDLVDFLWRDKRLVVETDGYVPHRGKVAFQDDRERDLRLRRLGYTVIRLSERQVDEETTKVAEVLRAELAPWSEYVRPRSQARRSRAPAT